MSKHKIKVDWESDHLNEAKTIGYMEGYIDGRIDILKELDAFKLLKKDWKKTYNNKTTCNYLIK